MKQRTQNETNHGNIVSIVVAATITTATGNHRHCCQYQPFQSCHARQGYLAENIVYTFSFYANQIIFHFIVNTYKIQLISTSDGKAYSPKCSVIKTYVYRPADFFHYYYSFEQMSGARHFASISVFGLSSSHHCLRSVLFCSYIVHATLSFKNRFLYSGSWYFHLSQLDSCSFALFHLISKTVRTHIMFP